MTPALALRTLDAAGVTVARDGARLTLKPAAAVPPDLRAWLAAGHWREVRAHLLELEAEAVRHGNDLERRYRHAAAIRARHRTGWPGAAERDAACRDARERRAQGQRTP